MKPRKTSPRTLGEIIDAGELIPSSGRKLSETELLAMAELSESQLETHPMGTLAPVRRSGRPKRGTRNEVTSVKSIRFPNSLWELIAFNANQESVSTNRWLEQAAVEKTRRDVHVKPAQHALKPSLNLTHTGVRYRVLQESVTVAMELVDA